MREIDQSERIFFILEKADWIPKSFSQDLHKIIEIDNDFYLLIYKYQGNKLILFEINNFHTNHQDFFSLIDLLSIRKGLVYEEAIDSLQEFILNNIDRTYFFDAH